MRLGKAKKYYVVDQVQGGLWNQIGAFTSKVSAERFRKGLPRTRVVYAWPASYSHPAERDRGRFAARSDEARSRGPSSQALYQVRAKGALSAKRNFTNYGDAQRYAWDLLGKGRTRVAMIYVRHFMDKEDRFGFSKRMEAWTIGKSGKFKHSY
jgi:hypothetical protein